jgi:putative ABC transport system permease protein
MEQYVQESAAVASRRFLLVLLSAFAAAALLLALIGVYGVIAYSVAQRTREVAIRVALGATAASIITLISRSGVRLLVPGLGIGTVAALGLTSGLRSLLYGVKSADPWTYGLVAVLLGVVVLLAGGIPARRATRVDPALTLRSE